MGTLMLQTDPKEEQTLAYATARITSARSVAHPEGTRVIPYTVEGAAAMATPNVSYLWIRTSAGLGTRIIGTHDAKRFPRKTTC